MEERTIKYIGNGLSISGVPARDLTPAEYKRHADLIQQCTQTLYELPAQKEKTPAKKEDKE